MDLKSRIDEFAGLEQGWNGYNAPPIPEMVIERSRRFASALKKEAEVFPTGRESIQFEFDNMEIEIFESEVEGFKSVELDGGLSGFKKENTVAVLLDEKHLLL